MDIFQLIEIVNFQIERNSGILNKIAFLFNKKQTNKEKYIGQENYECYMGKLSNGLVTHICRSCAKKKSLSAKLCSNFGKTVQKKEEMTIRFYNCRSSDCRSTGFKVVAPSSRIPSSRKFVKDKFEV